MKLMEFIFDENIVICRRLCNLNVMIIMGVRIDRYVDLIYVFVVIMICFSFCFVLMI